MIVTLRDRTEIYLTTEQGKRLELALLDPETPDYLKLDKITVRKDFIVKLQDGGHTQIDPERTLKAGASVDHRGKYSPAKERIREQLKGKIGASRTSSDRN